jgi:hypothetical protein
MTDTLYDTHPVRSLYVWLLMQVLLSDTSGFLPHASAQQGNQLVGMSPWQVGTALPWLLWWDEGGRTVHEWVDAGHGTAYQLQLADGD